MVGNIIDIFNFYIRGVIQVFQVMDSWELIPGVSYLSFSVACLVIIAFVSLLKFGYADDIQRYMSVKMPSYQSKHSEEYVAKHSKTGRKVRRNR